MSDFEIDNCGYYSMMNWSMIDSVDCLEMVAISNLKMGAATERKIEQILMNVNVLAIESR